MNSGYVGLQDKRGIKERQPSVHTFWHQLRGCICACINSSNHSSVFVCFRCRTWKLRNLEKKNKNKTEDVVGFRCCASDLHWAVSFLLFLVSCMNHTVQLLFSLLSVWTISIFIFLSLCSTFLALIREFEYSGIKQILESPPIFIGLKVIGQTGLILNILLLILVWKSFSNNNSLKSRTKWMSPNAMICHEGLQFNTVHFSFINIAFNHNNCLKAVCKVR